MKNVNSIDRFVRLLLGIAALELAFFWLREAWQLLAYALGVVLVATAVLRSCPLYRILGISTAAGQDRTPGKSLTVLAAMVSIAALVGGSYASAAFTRKLFLEEFNAVNHFYKQTLFLTGKGERDNAGANYDRLVPEFDQFQRKYAAYQPYALRGDTKLPADLQSVTALLSAVGPLVHSGDLHQAHLDLEKVRPVFQEIFKRNGFSMLAVALVDFHDAMELMLDAANARDVARVMSIYPQVSDKLKTVEEQANDAEIQSIRKDLDTLLGMASAGKPDELPSQASNLKSSFIKVYLQRG